MTDLRMRYKTTPFGSYTTVDVSAAGVANLRIVKGYNHPATATFSVSAAQHTAPIPWGAYVQIWDADGTDPDGAAYSSSNPTFCGHVLAPKPGDSNQVNYQLFDPTYRAQQKCNVMSETWQAGNVGTNTPPTAGAVAFPRQVFNVSIQNDDDWALQTAEGLTIGEIMQVVFDYQYHPLYWSQAAPGDGTSAGNGTAYVSGDLDLLTFVPQEKVVFESENVRGAVEQILRDEPHFRMVWHPGTQKWRIIDLTAATQVTLTLNDFSGTHKVMSLDLDPSMEGRYTATKIFGPQRVIPTIATTEDGSLSVVPESGVIIDTVGLVEVKSYTTFQIMDTTKRRMSRDIGEVYYVPMNSYYWIGVKSPTLQVSYDNGFTWGTVLGTYFDFWQGIAYIGLPSFWHTSEGRVVETGTQYYFPPDHYRLVYAYLGEPMFTREPPTGYAGTAYTVGGLANEQQLYDEMLAVGYNWFGTAVTTVERLAEFYKLAQKLHKERKDVVYTGGLTLEGIQYEFANLNRRVNIAGVDENGDAVTTGWEAINAWVTDVEFNYADNLTTLTFSSDQLALISQDVETFKKRLRLNALELRRVFDFSYISNPQFAYTKWGTRYLQQNFWGIASARDVWVNTQTGAEENT